MQDYTQTDPWRVFRIMAEFVEGFDELSNLGPAVSVFGSAQSTPEDPYYEQAVKLGRLLALNGFAVVTGGGPGIMQAANKGANEAGGVSVGLNIELPEVQTPNQYVTKLLSFRYFFVRKLMFSKHSIAFVVFPGGFGTLDEMFEALTLVQTDRIGKASFPVCLFGAEYWEPLLSWLRDGLLSRGYISAEDLQLFSLTDSEEDAVEIIKTQYDRDGVSRLEP